MSANPFDADHLVGHVKDAQYFEVPRFIASEGHLNITQPFPNAEPIINLKSGFGPLDEIIEPFDLQLTKFMILEVVAAVLVIIFFVALAAKIRKGQPVKGWFWNLLETMLLFIRDEVVRPAIGHGADKFLPFLWTVFFFVLGCNLLGMIPWLGSPTGALATTGALAFMTFGCVVVAGMQEMGFGGFFKNLVPHMDLPMAIAIGLKPMIFAIEVLGLFIKHFVLAVRLLANMMAGHLVLAVIVAFIAAAWQSAAVWAVAPASIIGATLLSLLELFVAFLQAYIFTFLSALFIGMSVHEH
jgi:F-type H+-transporting ATPase subunit a